MTSKDELKQIFERLQKAMSESNLSYGEIANITNIPKSAVHRYISGETPKIPLDRLKLLAKALNVTPAYLMGWENTDNENIPSNILPLPKVCKIPLLGTIACGEPIFAEENISDMIDVPEHINADFALRCKGDSMIDARINDGDIVYIKQQPTVDNGQIAAVLIGDEATLKRVYISDNTVTLMACNPRFAPLIYSGPELERLRIIGRAIAYTSLIK